ncbi:type VI secretion system-associated protein TagF [Lysobacter cavernae]|uniref:Type VI secretion system-associated protein TagF n=1 Tax=Lysobacter cavernae TaxID=1685901 RepID=A0ABV7RMH9_9GAMM
MTMPQAIVPGFYGKLPGAGDFVQRRLPPAFVEVWDRHFAQLVVHSREQLGAQWAAAYRNSGIRAFAIGAGVCGESAWAGVLGPGEDRVGRCFPLVIALPLLPAGVLDLAWYARAATVLTEVLTTRSLVADAFDARLLRLAPDPDATEVPGRPCPPPGQALWWGNDCAVLQSTGLLPAHDYLAWLAAADMTSLPQGSP